jgi:CheY-like chemotaxis protein
MDGQIGIHSTSGEGSLFWFTCRLGKQHNPEPEPQLSHQFDGRQVLVADHNNSCRETLTKQLEYWGAQVRSCGSSREAMSIQREMADAGKPLDYAFIDLALTDTDGLSLGRMIRESRLSPDMQMVIMVPFFHFESKDHYHRLGFAACLKKPIRHCALLDAVSILISGYPVHATAHGAGYSGAIPDAAHTPPGQDERILLAEDNLINQQVVTGIMKKLGYHHLDIVGNGREAITAMQRTHYSLVLMDIQMPELDGLQAAQTIRSGEAEVLDPQVPIIALTAHAMKGDREKYLACGMNGYISKPIDPVLLANTLEQHLFPARNSLLSRQQGSDQEPQTDDSDSPLVDYPAFVSRLLGDTELAAKIFSMFLEDLPNQIEILSQATDKKDFPAIENQAHKIKGATGNVCAHRLNRTIHRLEVAAKAHNYHEVQRLLRSAQRLQIMLQETEIYPISIR